MLGHAAVSELPVSGFAPAGGGSTYTLSCDAGSFTLTGQDATLKKTSILSAGAGSFALTGQDATLAIGRRLTADAGAYTLTGQDALFTYTPVAGRPAHQAYGGGRGRDETREYLRKKAIQKLPIRLLPETVEHIAARAKKQAWMPDEEIEAYYFTFWED